MAFKVMDAKQDTGAGPSVKLNAVPGQVVRPVQISVAGTGAVTATVDLEIQVEGSGVWTKLGATAVLSGTTTDSAIATAWNGSYFLRGNVTAIGGTGAAVSIWVD